MKRSIPMPKIACAGLLVIVVCAPLAASDVKPRADFARRATWKSPTPAEVREQVSRWMEAAQLDPAVRARVEMLWSMDVAAEGDRTGESTLLDRVVASLAAADPRAAELALVCSQPRRQIALPDVAWLADDATEQTWQLRISGGAEQTTLLTALQALGAADVSLLLQDDSLEV